jgi:mono/diheme cytochrome c family protein
MKFRILPLCAVGLTAAMMSAISISQTINGGPDSKNSAELARGQKIFQRNCASCHGLDGKGAGMVASALKKQPADLTVIPLKNGRFPSEELIMTISGELTIPLHGSREMPIWGGVLKNGEVLSLVRYIESLQRTMPAK